MPHLSIVAPVYNEQEVTLVALADRIAAALAGITSDYEVILVDDGSRLETWAAICSVARTRPQVKGLRFSRNFGQHPAIAAGVDHATGEWVVVMDSDLQDRPEVIPDLYRKAQDGFDVVFVNRQQRPETALYQLCAGVFYKTLNFLAGQKYERRQANYSIVSAKVVEAFKQVPDRDRFYGGTVRWLGFEQSSIDARHGDREYGQPSYNLRGRFRFAFRMIFGFSTRLLYLAIVLGLLLALVSFGMALDIVVYKILHPTVPIPGWPSVMTAVFFTAGVTNVMLGLVGIYIGSLVEQSKNRPIYLIERETNFIH